MGRSNDEAGVDEGASALVAKLVLVLIGGICELMLELGFWGFCDYFA